MEICVIAHYETQTHPLPRVRFERRNEDILGGGSGLLIMSAAIQVFLRDAHIPTVNKWNAAIKAEGFDLILESFGLQSDDGYRPAMLKGEESGFEWCLSPVATAEEQPHFPFKLHIGDCDLRAQLCFTSYADEEKAAAIAGAVLAKMTGGYYWDAETDNRFLQGDAAIAAARKLIQAKP